MKTTIVIFCMVAALTFPSLTIAQSSQTAESPELVKSREITATAIRLFNGGQSAEALPLAKQALDLREKALGIDHEDLIPLLTNLAEITKSLKKLEESEAFFNRALKIAEKTYGTDNIRIAAILDRLAFVEHDLGRDAVAEKVFVRSLKLKEGSLEPNDLEIAQTAYNLAQVYRIRGEYQKAAPLYQRAVKIREHSLEKDHTNLIKSLEGYVFVLTALKKNDEAADAQKRLAELLTEKAVVYGGILNGKALVLLQPSYPLAAREARAMGMVQVEVFIDENGNVTAAKATNASKLHPALVRAAEAAARKSRFSPTFVDGAAVKVRGIIVYNFVAQ